MADDPSIRPAPTHDHPIDPWANVKPSFGFPRHYLVSEVDTARAADAETIRALRARVARVEQAVLLLRTDSPENRLMYEHADDGPCFCGFVMGLADHAPWCLELRAVLTEARR